MDGNKNFVQYKPCLEKLVTLQLTQIPELIIASSDLATVETYIIRLRFHDKFPYKNLKT